MADVTRKKTWVEEHLPSEYLAMQEQNKLPAARRIGYGKHPALLIIDMYRAWTDPTSPMGKDMSDTVSVIKNILDVARQTQPKIPIIFLILRKIISASNQSFQFGSLKDYLLSLIWKQRVFMINYICPGEMQRWKKSY